MLVSLDYVSTCLVRPIVMFVHNFCAGGNRCLVFESARAPIIALTITRHSSVDAEILYLAASWIQEEYKFILIVLIKHKYPFSQLEGSKSLFKELYSTVRQSDKQRQKEWVQASVKYECFALRIRSLGKITAIISLNRIIVWM